MTKRKNNNLKLFIVMGITLVLAIMAVQTIWVGYNLWAYSNDVVESSWNAEYYPQIREGANKVYEAAMEGRSKFYNSENLFIRWISNMNNNLIRLPLSLLIITSPVWFLYLVRTYNLNKRRRRARR